MTNRTNLRRVLVGAILVAAGLALFACSGDDEPIAPPLNDSGLPDTASPDGGAPDASDGGGPPPSCASLPGTVIFVESGDTQQPLLKRLGRELRDKANVTLAYQLTGSCTLAPNLYQGTPIPKSTNMLYVPSTAEDSTWTTSQPERTCTTDATAATAPNLGISALFPSSCQGLGAPPPGIGSFIGPIQAYTFIVPTAEFGTQKAISAVEAYYALGSGNNNPVTYNANPEWNDPTQFFLRPATKSTLVATALEIGLTAKQATLATPDGGTADGRRLLSASTDVLAQVAASTNMNAIGILGDEIYDANRGKGVAVLAFRAFGQSLAYFPDSTTTSFDKQNIRDGHYTLWSPTVYITPVDGGGAPTSAAVKLVIDLVLGNPAAQSDGGAGIDGLGAVVGVGLTPNCAMQVQRSGDGAPLSPYAPPAPCTCAFLAKIPNAPPLPASCVACSTQSTCVTGSCFNGYCEVPPVGVAPTTIDKLGVVYPTTGDGGLLPPNP